MKDVTADKVRDDMPIVSISYELWCNLKRYELIDWFYKADIIGRLFMDQEDDIQNIINAKIKEAADKFNNMVYPKDSTIKSG